MERFNGSSFSANHNFVHEIENGAEMDALHDEDGDLQNYLLFQHLNPPIVADSHLQVYNGLVDPNDSAAYYMNGGHQVYHHQPDEQEVVYLDEDIDQKPEIKKEIVPENETLQDISIDKEFKEDTDGRVNLSTEYIKCLQEAKKSNRCLICNDSFKKLDQTIEHLQVEHFTEVYNYRYNCLNCRVAYRSSKRFNVHKTHIHNDTELFKCADCNNKILSKFKVYKHLLKNRHCRKSSIKFVHTEMNQRTNVENVCLDCLRIFKNVAALSNHIKTCEGIIANNQTTTTPSSTTTNNEAELRRRSNRMVSSTSVSSNNSTSAAAATTAVSKRRCQYCDEFISNNIERHEESCRKKICPKCSKVFTTGRNTIRHLINIHRVPKNQCDILWNESSTNKDMNENEEDEEDDEDVVLSVDCCTHEEIPLKRNRIG